MTEAELIGLVITECRAVENALRERGASGNGLRELTESRPDLLSPEARQLLRWIGAVRNAFAHQGTPGPELGFEPEFFRQSCRTVLIELGVKPEPPAKPKNPARRRAAGVDPVPAPGPGFADLAVWLPGVQLCYPARTAWRAVREVWPSLLALALYGGLITLLFFPGLRNAGWGLLVAIYILGLAEYHRGRPLRQLLWLPVVNLGYFLSQTLFRLRWKQLAAALFTLALTGAGVALLASGHPRAGLVALIFGYAAAILLHYALRGSEERS